MHSVAAVPPANEHLRSLKEQGRKALQLDRLARAADMEARVDALRKLVKADLGGLHQLAPWVDATTLEPTAEVAGGDAVVLVRVPGHDAVGARYAYQPKAGAWSRLPFNRAPVQGVRAWWAVYREGMVTLTAEDLGVALVLAERTEAAPY